MGCVEPNGCLLLTPLSIFLAAADDVGQNTWELW
jgi:hypothetical protein